MAELYLSIAECYAALNDIDNAIKYLAPVRKRAGLPELTRQTINDSGYDIRNGYEMNASVNYGEKAIVYTMYIVGLKALNIWEPVNVVV